MTLHLILLIVFYSYNYRISLLFLSYCKTIIIINAYIFFNRSTCINDISKVYLLYKKHVLI